MLDRQTDRKTFRLCEKPKRRSNLTFEKALKLFGLPRRNSVSPRNDTRDLTQNDVKHAKSCFPFTLSFSLSSGFTLAEVLITLGIIGFVAALTIPTLMNNIQERQFKEAAKKAYSTASQAVSQMRRDEGDSLLKYTQTTGSFKPIFMTYFKVIKDYGSNEYSAITTAGCTYKTLIGTAPNCYAADDGQFVTSDGVFWGFDNYLSPIKITVDVNGAKDPNTFGKDVFMFEIVNDKLLPMGAPGTSHTTPTYCSRTINTALQGFGCMNYVMQNKDY